MTDGTAALGNVTGGKLQRVELGGTTTLRTNSQSSPSSAFKRATSERRAGSSISSLGSVGLGRILPRLRSLGACRPPVPLEQLAERSSKR